MPQEIPSCPNRSSHCTSEVNDNTSLDSTKKPKSSSKSRNNVLLLISDLTDGKIFIEEMRDSYDLSIVFWVMIKRRKNWPHGNNPTRKGTF